MGVNASSDVQTRQGASARRFAGIRSCSGSATTVVITIPWSNNCPCFTRIYSMKTPMPRKECLNLPHASLHFQRVLICYIQTDGRIPTRKIRHSSPPKHDIIRHKFCQEVLVALSLKHVPDSILAFFAYR